MTDAFTLADGGAPAPWRRAAEAAALFAGLAAYVAIGVGATLFYPFLFFVFLAPFAVIGFAALPKGKASPQRLIAVLAPAAIALISLWPVYLHLKIGPLPIITPPRLIFYALTVLWLYDMTASPLRRGQFVLALKRSPVLCSMVFGLFLLSALSAPTAQGKAIATQEFLRLSIIWLLPFCAFATYVRSFAALKRILAAIVIAAAASGAIALIETGAQTLLASVLSPFISDDATWLQIAQSQKIRDGIFRAQATHTHPVSLGEMLALCGPLAMAFAVSARGRGRIVWSIAVFLIYAGIFATSSRAAMLAGLAGFGLMALFIVTRLIAKPRHYRYRPLAGFAVFCFAALSPALIYGAHKVVSGDAGTSAARSTQSRFDQVEMAWPKIAQRPLTGYGTGRAVRVIGYWGLTLTLDNYYLTLAVDNGLGAPALFAATIIAAGLTFRRRIKKRAPPGFVTLLVGLACGLAVFLLSRVIISQTGNLSVYYPLLGALVGAGVRFAPRRA